MGLPPWDLGFGFATCERRTSQDGSFNEDIKLFKWGRVCKTLGLEDINVLVC